MNDDIRLELKNISKSYSAVKANDDISLRVKAGEIHAVLGENGAGKSTLMKIIYGAIKADEGLIFFNGDQVTIKNPAQARKLGIGMVFQHFSLFDSLTVVENIALAINSREPLPALSEKILELSRSYGLDVDPERHIYSLPVGVRQRVEIIRCLLQNPQLLIMDEPTSVLTPQAVQKLFTTLKKLAEKGCSILYISHKLDEIMQLCDRATVLKDGKVSGMVTVADSSSQKLARLMTGTDTPVCVRSESRKGENILEVKELSHASESDFGISLSDISFGVRAGEILGVAGVSDNGQQELLALLSGEIVSTKNQGEILFKGRVVNKLDAGERRKLGLCFVPEERIGRGAVPYMSLWQNSILTGHRQNMVQGGFISFADAVRFTDKCIADFKVKCSSNLDVINNLSGGNIQKFILGREINLGPELLIVGQPTWGVDIGAAALIRQEIINLADKGTAVLVVSEDLDELFEICDKLVVMEGGRVSPMVRVEEVGREEIGLWMSGLFSDDEKLLGQVTG